jgi:hypothetical protein
MARAQLTATLKLYPPKKKESKSSKSGKRDDQTLGSLNLSLHWKISLASLSGLTLSGLSLKGEYYRLYKGVRNIVCRVVKKACMLEMGTQERTACKQQLQMEKDRLLSQNSETVLALQIESHQLECLVLHRQEVLLVTILHRT